MTVVCPPAPGRVRCHPLPLFGPMSTPCPCCCGFTTAAAAKDRAEVLHLQQLVYGKA